MSNSYDFNSDNSKNQLTNIPLTDHVSSSGTCKKRSRHKRNSRRNMAKRIGALTLSAVLFGSVAAGSFQMVNHLYAGSDTSASKGAAHSADAADTGLLKTTSVTGNGNSTTGSLDVSAIAEAAMPSIVSISNKSIQEVQDYFSQSIYGVQGYPQTKETESQGSGIIIGKNDTELLLVTNNHVVANADTLTVSFIDNHAAEAQIKGTDSTNDLAVISVPLANIPEETMSKIAVANIGDSDDLKVGEQVIAIGNALGYGQSVTTGIASAVNRTIAGSSSDTDGAAATYIQTDAAINPGNSGGALLNTKGQVIGINTAKLSSTAIEGMGYAIPMSRASQIIEGLMTQTARSKVSPEEQGTIGIKGVDVNSEAQKMYGLPEGIYISEVTSKSAAEAAGITAGSVMTSFDGKSVSGISQLQTLLPYYKAGETVEVTLQVPSRDNTFQEKTVSLTLTGNSNSNYGQTGNLQQTSQIIIER